jgi:hypothetical protein
MRAILGLDDRNPAVSAMKFAIPGENGKQTSIVVEFVGGRQSGSQSR